MMRWTVAELWVDSVGAKPVNRDWSEGYAKEWDFHEAPSCPECDTYCEYEYKVDEWVCPNDSCEEEGVEPLDDEGRSGPMMNYHYPLPDVDRVGGAEEAASSIADLPLCVVDWMDGTYSLALTGGGMDLSWEICEAFTRLGFLPPLHFCDLPKMAYDESTYVVAACKRSADIAAGWAASTSARLAEFDG